MHSPPRPKTTLPASITPYLFLIPPKAKINYPTVKIVVNSKRPILKK
jgi:hypothetical protein